MLIKNFIMLTNGLCLGIGNVWGGNTLDQSYSKVRPRNKVSLDVFKIISQIMNELLFLRWKIDLKNSSLHEYIWYIYILNS